MMKYGMVGNFGLDGKRVVLWDLSQVKYGSDEELAVVEKEIQYFISGFQFALEGCTSSEYVYLFRKGGREHKIMVDDSWLCYLLEEGKLCKYSRTDCYLDFIRAF
jgi:hypothetical protein